MCIDRGLEAVTKTRATPDHRLRISEDDPRLIPCGGKRIHLCSTLHVCDQHVERKRRRERGLGVAPGDFNVRAAKPALAVRLDPSKSRRKDEDLPRLEPDLLPGQRTLNVGQLLNKPADVVCRPERLPGFGLEPGVELVRAGLSLELGQVVELALRSGLGPSAGEDFPFDDLLRVTVSHLRVSGRRH